MAAREAERLARGSDRGAECSALVARLRELKREAAELWFSVEKLADDNSLAVGVASRKLKAAGPLGVVLLRQVVREGTPTAVVRGLGLLADGPAARFINDVSRRFATESDPQLRKALVRILIANVADIPPGQLACLAEQAEATLATEPGNDDSGSLELIDLLIAAYAGPAGSDTEVFDALVDRPGLAGRLGQFVTAAGESGSASLARWAGRHLATFGKVLDYPALALWLTADQGVETEAEGIVTAWNDRGPPPADADRPAQAKADEAGSRPRIVETDRGPAIEFDGSDDYLRLPAGYASFPDGISVLAIVRPTKFGRYNRLIDLGNGPNSDNVILCIGGKPGMLGAWSFPKAGGGRGVEAADVLTADRWHHLVATIDPQGEAALFVDGKPVATGPTAPLANVPREKCFIGQSNWNTGPGQGQTDMLAGQIRELRMYRRVLSAEEVAREASLMAPGSKPDAPPP